MEGERDDIQFYFGKAFRCLKRTERDMTRKITDKVSLKVPHVINSIINPRSFPHTLALAFLGTLFEAFFHVALLCRQFLVFSKGHSLLHRLLRLTMSKML